MIDKIVEFGKEAKKLVETSSFRERLEWLLERPELGKIANKNLPFCHPAYNKPSNCFGTLLFIVNANNVETLPQFEEQETMDFYIKKRCEKADKEKDIVILRCKEGKIRHAALYLGRAAGYSAIFHQPGTGEDYTMHPLEKFLKWNPTFESADFYKIKVI